MKELEGLKKFLLSESSEKAKDYLVFPLFQNLFKSKFKKETDAKGADTYIEGKLLVELKTGEKDFIAAFFQALHYAKKGLSFSSICVIAYKFICVWKINNIPDFAKKLASEADAITAPNEIGRVLERKVTKAQKNDILKTAVYKLFPEDFEGIFGKDIDLNLFEFKNVLKTLDSERSQINRHNFINTIELMKKFFDNPLDAIHCFYAIVGYWDVTSTVALKDNSDYVNIVGYKGSKLSENIYIKPKFFLDFKKFVESRFVFTNEGSGLTVDYYFSRFDEVITRLDPEYAKQHGIFFTDHNLSKFALWFVREEYEKKLSEKYIVLDPAGGSGNLVMSWKGHLKHKIVCELQPDLLKLIERRMKLDPDHIQAGFTVVPKTSSGEGLNFLDKPAEKYIRILADELKEKHQSLDKPLAFLLNPPYKNTDENEGVRKDKNAHYEIDSTILELTGDDAGKERYLGFLAQIVNIARLQMGDSNPIEGSFDFAETMHKLDKTKVKEKPLLLIFTPSSWLIPRPTYVPFREIFDKYFKYEKGFIILGNEFFKIQGRFPISFTIWSYNYKEKGNKNKVVVRDLTNLKADDLNINWNLPDENINKQVKGFWKNSKDILFSQNKDLIKDLCEQKMYDFKRDATDREIKSGIIFGGLPLKDERRTNKKTYGIVNSKYIGFMDNISPVRIKEDNYNRMSNKPDRVWFRLDNAIADVNKSCCSNGPLPVKGYCAFDLNSAIKTFSWFSLTKSINGRYPVWANQFDIWAPDFSKIDLNEKKIEDFQKYFYSLCFAFGLAENRCVVTKFEKDNPVPGAPEIFIDNPLCPSNPDSFWSTTLDSEIPDTKPGNKKLSNPAKEMVKIIKELYKIWNNKYCKSQFLYNVGLHNEPYFKYFDYADFLTPYSGLIQIKKYAELQNLTDIGELFRQITAKSKQLKDEIYNILINDLKYFE
ncbi:MAG: hypothetical protein HY959_08435 [Ignavibacteriae bacterium]|nr:hypothetical protein [Ignavibacteriota bacterium]